MSHDSVARLRLHGRPSLEVGADERRASASAVPFTGDLGPPVYGARLLGLQAAAGNAAVAHLVGRSTTHRALVGPGATIQRADGGAGAGTDEAVALTSGVGVGGGSTSVGPPTRSTYAVSGSLADAANTVSARTEAGSETSTPSLDTVTDDGRIVSATVTVAQAIELPSWSGRAGGTATQQAEWDRFSAALSAHEDGHVAKDVAAWAGAHRKIVGKSEKGGNDTLDAISAAADKANDDYDTATKHGLTQGTGIDPNV